MFCFHCSVQRMKNASGDVPIEEWCAKYELEPDDE